MLALDNFYRRSMKRVEGEGGGDMRLHDTFIERSRAMPNADVYQRPIGGLETLTSGFARKINR